MKLFKFMPSSIAIPEKVGVMILPDCVVFPHGSLPLHIFEDRYRKMLEDAIESHCFFAIAQPLIDSENNIAKIGTVGMVRASRETKDGTSNLLLHGIIRVRFENWLNNKQYPFAEITPLPSIFKPKTQVNAALETLRETIKESIEHLPADVQSAINQILLQSDDPSVLSDIVAQQFIHDADDRQMLLEELSPAARISWLCQAITSK
jgi:uncharacterized protein